jgi:phosphate-selective porin OprO and OprP
MKRLAILLLSVIVVLFTTEVQSQGCGDAPSDEGVQVFGFIQSQYEMDFLEETENSFTFERARIGVQGIIPYDFSYYAVLELSPLMSSEGKAYLLDAFVTYDRFKWARVSVGSFKTPFGLETNTPCNGLITVYRSTATLQMVAPFRDMGMVFMGGDKNTKLNYQLGIMNGSGIGDSDNNKKKDIVGRITYKPIDFVQVGGSFRYGYPKEKHPDSVRTTFSGEVKMNYEGATLMGEYIMDEGAIEQTLGGGCGGGDLLELGNKRSGGWIAVAYKTQWDVEPVFKFDFFDRGNDLKEKETNLTFGINYYFNDWTRLQINYVYTADEPYEIPNDRFVIQLQAKF